MIPTILLRAASIFQVTIERDARRIFGGTRCHRREILHEAGAKRHPGKIKLLIYEGSGASARGPLERISMIYEGHNFPNKCVRIFQVRGRVNLRAALRESISLSRRSCASCEGDAATMKDRGVQGAALNRASGFISLVHGCRSPRVMTVGENLHENRAAPTGRMALLFF